MPAAVLQIIYASSLESTVTKISNFNCLSRRDVSKNNSVGVDEAGICTRLPYPAQ